MPLRILHKMQNGVFYPGHHLGNREMLSALETQGLIERMDASSLCGPDSEPAYCLTPAGCRMKRASARRPRNRCR
ncbi:MAG: hypothetical protein MUD16_04455 [Desulfobacterales bacterium]|nr:hypothetical protein [Desulfobacterales bacterium]